LGLEALEDRCVPTVFTVNSLADLSLAAGVNPATGAINGTSTVTLRSAIEATNMTPGGNTIDLAVAGTYQIRLFLVANETDNQAGEFAILSPGNLTIQNTSGGTVTVDGGGLARVFDVNPAAENTTAFTVTFQGLTIQHGSASPGDGDQGSGGGIRAQGAANIVLDNVSLLNNTATADGGGIALESIGNVSTGTLTITNSTISNNHAGDAGGGIETDGTGLVSITGGAISENTCLNQGAGVWLDAGGASLSLTDVLVQGNQAITMLAGGIGNAGGGNVTLTGCTVADNFSGGNGGGFGDAANTGDLVVTNCTFLDNTAAGNGGGIQEGGPQTTIDGTVFDGNTSAGAGGGGLFVNGQVVQLSNDVFRHNDGGGNAGGGGVDDRATTFTATGCTFDSNSALGTNGGNGNNAGDGGFGGAVLVSVNGGTATFTQDLFVGNTANNGINGTGGAIDAVVGTLTISQSQFTANAASDVGGAVYFGGTTLSVTDSTFNSNSGGALQDVDSTTVTLTNDTFTGNTTPGDGGALDIEQSGTATLLNDTITGNTAVFGGGLVTFPDGLGGQEFVVQNTIIALNTAPMGPDIETGGVHFVDNGGNLIGNLSGVSGFGAGTLTGVNPQLGPLANNGGFVAGAPGDQQVVQTEALLAGSPAIGTGVATGAPAADERGFGRVIGRIDIGAFEFQALASTLTLTASASPAQVGQPVTFTATVGSQTPGTNAVPTGTVTFTIDGMAQAPVALVNGVASLTVPSLAFGQHTVTVSYGGDVNFTASTRTLTETVSGVRDASDMVRVVRFRPIHHGNTCRQMVLLRNMSGAPIQGPLYLLLDRLTPGVRLMNATGTSQAHVTPGDPYLMLSAGQLAAGGATVVDLIFYNPHHKAVKFNTFVLAGPGVV
jgi:hypothetical protein